MENEQRDTAMEEIRAARPDMYPSAEEWARSGRGRRVYERVMAEVDTIGSAVGGHDRWAWSNKTWRIAAAAAAAVMVVGLSLGLGFGLKTADQGSVVQDPSTTLYGTGTSGALAAVSKSEAVENVMRLVYASTYWMADSADTQEPDPTALLSEAVERGLVTSAELAEAAAQPMHEGQHAALLWEAFGTFFPDSVDVGLPEVNVVGEVEEEVLTAVEGLQRVGVIRESDGDFDSEQLLEPVREELLLDRMEAALEGEVVD